MSDAGAARVSPDLIWKGDNDTLDVLPLSTGTSLYEEALIWYCFALRFTKSSPDYAMFTSTCFEF